MSGTPKQSQIEEEIPLDIEEDFEPRMKQKKEKQEPKYYECDGNYSCFDISSVLPPSKDSG